MKYRIIRQSRRKKYNKNSNKVFVILGYILEDYMMEIIIFFFNILRYHIIHILQKLLIFLNILMYNLK